MRLWCELYTEVGRYLGSTQNGVTDLGCDLEVGYKEAALSRERGPGIHNDLLEYWCPC